MKKIFFLLSLAYLIFACNSNTNTNPIKHSISEKTNKMNIIDSTEKVMKVLLINGSPNIEGCTFTALTEIAKSLNSNGISTEIIHIGDKDIRGCIACRKCKTTGKCVFDDIVNEIAEKAKTADGFIFGAPVYYSGINGTMKSFLDRLFFSGSEYFAFKPGAGIVSARRAGTTAALQQLNQYFMINQMPIPSSHYWNMVHGNTPDEVKKDKEGMQIMRTLGNNMAWLLHSIEAGKNAGIEIPVQEPRERTNFIRE